VIDQEIRVGIDVGCKAHRVGIANTTGKILEEFDISHTDAGFRSSSAGLIITGTS